MARVNHIFSYNYQENLMYRSLTRLLGSSYHPSFFSSNDLQSEDLERDTEWMCVRETEGVRERWISLATVQNSSSIVLCYWQWHPYALYARMQILAPVISWSKYSCWTSNGSWTSTDYIFMRNRWTFLNSGAQCLFLDHYLIPPV